MAVLTENVTRNALWCLACVATVWLVWTSLASERMCMIVLTLVCELLTWVEFWGRPWRISLLGSLNLSTLQYQCYNGVQWSRLAHVRGRAHGQGDTCPELFPVCYTYQLMMISTPYCIGGLTLNTSTEIRGSIFYACFTWRKANS